MQEYAGLFTYNLGTLPPEEAILLFQHWNKFENSEAESVERILEYVNYNSLVIEVTAKQITKDFSTPTEFYNILSTRGYIQTSSTKISSGKSSLKTKTPYEHICDLFELSKYKENPSQLLILQVMALVFPSQIHVRELKILLTLSDMNEINSIIDGGFLQCSNDGFLSIHPLLNEVICLNTNMQDEHLTRLLLKIYDEIYCSGIPSHQNDDNFPTYEIPQSSAKWPFDISQTDYFYWSLKKNREKYKITNPNFDYLDLLIYTSMAIDTGFLTSFINNRNSDDERETKALVDAYIMVACSHSTDSDEFCLKAIDAIKNNKVKYPDWLVPRCFGRLCKNISSELLCKVESILESAGKQAHTMSEHWQIATSYLSLLTNWSLPRDKHALWCDQLINHVEQLHSSLAFLDLAWKLCVEGSSDDTNTVLAILDAGLKMADVEKNEETKFRILLRISDIEGHGNAPHSCKAREHLEMARDLARSDGQLKKLHFVELSIGIAELRNCIMSQDFDTAFDIVSQLLALPNEEDIKNHTKTKKPGDKELLSRLSVYDGSRPLKEAYIVLSIYSGKGLEKALEYSQALQYEESEMSSRSQWEAINEARTASIHHLLGNTDYANSLYESVMASIESLRQKTGGRSLESLHMELHEVTIQYLQNSNDSSVREKLDKLSAEISSLPDPHVLATLEMYYKCYQQSKPFPSLELPVTQYSDAAVYDLIGYCPYMKE